MCGIIGITQHTVNGVGNVIYEGLTRLEYRGYDSVGLAVLTDDSNIEIAKDKGPIKEVGTQLHFSDYQGRVAIGHSRWATHGPPSQKNAHPHLSMGGKVAVVHNGIIENFLELKEMLIGEGFTFKSETDTEVIPNLMELYLNQGMKVFEAIRKLIGVIEGTFAIVMITTEDPDKIYTFRRDNPLVIGIGKEENYCASDIPAFLPYTNKVVILKDDELAVLDPDRVQIYDLKTWELKERKPKTISWTAEAAQKGGYPHFMLKEIHEQQKVLRTQLSTQQEGIAKAAEYFKRDKIVLVAAGTAFHASLAAFYTFQKFGGKIVVPCIAAEWDSVEAIVDENTLIVACSQSGETLDTIKAVKVAKERGADVLAIVNVTDSTLTRLADHVVYIHAGPEIGVAATKTYTTLDFAVWRIFYEYSRMNSLFSDEEMQEFKDAIERTPEIVAKMVQRYEAQSRKIAKWLATKTSIYYLGRGISYVSALEGALKIKEISYIHAEAFPAGESKHGPIALIEEDFPVVFTIPRDDSRHKMMGSVQEMKARGATTIGIIEEGDEEMKSQLDHVFEVPKGVSKFLSTTNYQIPMQFLAYFTSIARGYNPDRPRNLAKSVTVE